MKQTSIVIAISEQGYGVQFDADTTAEWAPQLEYNLIKVRSVAQYAQQMLAHRGFLFLNEIFEELGLPRTPEGQVVGWVHSDGYLNVEAAPLRGEDVHSADLWITFNVQGVMVNQI